MGRTDGNKRVVLARRPVPDAEAVDEEVRREAMEAMEALRLQDGGVEARAGREVAGVAASAEGHGGHVELQPGDYVAVRVTEAISANTLRAEPLARCSLARFAESVRRYN